MAESGDHRTATIVLTIGTVIGVVLVFALGRYQDALAAWLRSDQSALPRRARLMFGGLAAGASLQTLAFAVYAWSLGRTRPPGQALLLKAVAVLIAAAAVAMGVLLWRTGATVAARGI